MNDLTKQKILKNRELLKAYTAADAAAEPTDQQQKLPFPLPEKEPRSGEVISLPTDFEKTAGEKSLYELIAGRESCREYAPEPLTLNELAFLLWATQGVRKFAGRFQQVTFRNVPSAGSRHAFETYLFIQNVEGLAPGIYHYLASRHALEVWEDRKDFSEELERALGGQNFAVKAPVVFVWSAMPYRMEWRYGLKSHKYMLIDAGHVCENLYLACEAIGCGTCAIGAYDQELLDELLGFAPGPSAEKDYECAVYAAPVGKHTK